MKKIITAILLITFVVYCKAKRISSNSNHVTIEALLTVIANLHLKN